MNSENDWRLFRQSRNQYYKAIKEEKNRYYSTKLTVKNKKDNDISNEEEYNTENKLWSTVKELANTKTRVLPRLISFNNTVTTSLKEIANIACKHYIDKINKIRSKFTPHAK